MYTYDLIDGTENSPQGRNDQMRLIYTLLWNK